MNAFKLATKFPINTPLYITVSCYDDKKVLLSDQDIIKIVPNGVELELKLLACNSRKWTTPIKTPKSTSPGLGPAPIPMTNGHKAPCPADSFISKTYPTTNWNFKDPEFDTIRADMIRARDGACVPGQGPDQGPGPGRYSL